MDKKRVYCSQHREAQAFQTRSKILHAAKQLFTANGFERVTINMLAKAAKVSMPTIYALFKSKCGLLQALIDDTLPVEQFNALVDASMQEKSAKIRLKLTAELSRQIYEAERELIDILRGAAVVAPEFKELEVHREKRRYDRQQCYIRKLMEDKVIAKGLTMQKAHDILWSLTGRDIFRMLVIERGWSYDEYEKWLGKILIDSLLDVDCLKK